MNIFNMYGYYKLHVAKIDMHKQKTFFLFVLIVFKEVYYSFIYLFVCQYDLHW